MNVLLPTVTSARSGSRSEHQVPRSGDERPSFDTAITTIATMLDPNEGRLSENEVRQLQHLSLDHPESPVLQSILASLHLTQAPSWIQPDRWHRQWAVLLKGMAICAGLHEASVSVGEALARAEWPNDRFTRMMEAGPDEIVTYVEWAARHLAEAEQPVNWNDMRRLMFKSGEHARQFRVRVANDFFRTSYALRRKRL